MQVPKEQVGLDPLKQAISEYLQIPGMKAAILVSNQGLMISSATADHVDTDGIAALAIDAMAAAQRFGYQLSAGSLDTMSIEFETLTVVLAPFTEDVMLALVGAPESMGALHCASKLEPTARPVTGSAGGIEAPT